MRTSLSGTVSEIFPVLQCKVAACIVEMSSSFNKIGPLIELQARSLSDNTCYISRGLEIKKISDSKIDLQGHQAIGIGDI